jgi:hypothetical protein
VIEPTLDQALGMVERGEIVDGKTIMLLQHLALQRARTRKRAGRLKTGPRARDGVQRTK